MVVFPSSLRQTVLIVLSYAEAVNCCHFHQHDSVKICKEKMKWTASAWNSNGLTQMNTNDWPVRWAATAAAATAPPHAMAGKALEEDDALCA